ncbi:BLUF domain-containing protein [Planktothrix sp. FACHB-1355]|uniref:BLUF domain-containing protein n=1 Tax=Aerosakkonema funiforme FACHB-1375 TaxID=2949571 RepID=A0A926VIX3_9CYAN|nr:MULTISPECIES: BLUF domain-containing protein [Oscillatoriales]MBD2184741.1 BLUF domain-containing protein [Aerosakkonema funiforme FACHB-1375]MBD3558935.1 BLUF domain-containing protein [Planktothrix sp. FACHB-1355]
MKRLTYISKFARPLSSKEIEAIGKVSAPNNQAKNITGVLLCSQGIFFQILEGDEENIDRLYEKILRDRRHTDILCLNTEHDIKERLFPEWSIQTIDLDENTDLIIKPIRALLQTLNESYRILEKYTQPTVVNIISNGANPLLVPPRKVEKIILFSDIVSFSTLVEKLPCEEIVAILNQYFTICTNIIVAKGGEITKFIGDCVMAYFSGEQADAAIQASLDILTEIETVRISAPEGSPLRVLYNGIGLAQGEVIEGNIGSHVKMDYTILGDAVNIAQRLECLTRKLSRSLIFSLEVKNSTAGVWNFVKLGKSKVKGKEEAIEIYSIDDRVTKQPSSNAEMAADISNYLDKIKFYH